MNVDVEKIYDTARTAGDAIMDVYASEDFGVERKSDDSPLTEADRCSNDVIVEGLRVIDPSIPILSEESREISFTERKDWERFWLVDPLDGNKEFIKRNGEFTVNIAFICGFFFQN